MNYDPSGFLVIFDNLIHISQLGTESTYQGTHSKIKSTPSKPAHDGEFEELAAEWTSAARLLEEYRNRKVSEGMVKGQLVMVKEKRLAMDAYNRYAVFVRGASPDVYGILKKAGIAKEFATLLGLVKASLTTEEDDTKHMRPLEHLGRESAHADWMSEYVVRLL